MSTWARPSVSASTYQRRDVLGSARPFPGDGSLDLSQREPEIFGNRIRGNPRIVQLGQDFGTDAPDGCRSRAEPWVHDDWGLRSSREYAEGFAFAGLCEVNYLQILKYARVEDALPGSDFVDNEVVLGKAQPFL